MEGQRVIVIPNFSDPKYSVRGHSAEYKTEKDTALDWLGITTYPNGNTPDNEGHVSFELYKISSSKHDVSYLNCTVSVVDANGESRYPQSFGIQGVGEGISSLGEVSFIRRCVVLDPEKELLHKGTLTLQMDFSWENKTPSLDIFCNLSENELDKMHLEDRKSINNNKHYLVGVEEMYSHSKVSLATKYLRLIFEHPFVSCLRNDSSPTCLKLSVKSQYYERQFKTLVDVEDFMFLPRKILNKKRNGMRLPKTASLSTDLIIFLQQEHLDHVDRVEKCTALYYLSHKYGMFDLKKICRERIISLFTSENAVEILDVAQLCKDGVLCDYVIVYSLLNLKTHAERTVLPQNEQYFVSRLAHNIEFQNLGVESGLRRSVLNYVFQNWGEVQKYTQLTSKVTKLIVSCLIKDFDLYILNLFNFVHVVEYEQHVKDYEFYS